MSGKGSGKKRNRAAQSEQHGYQEPHATPAIGHSEGAAGGLTAQSLSEKQRVIEKLKGMEQRRRNQQE